MNRRKVVLCDIDNCISDDGWRISTIDWTKQGDARYARYHALAHADEYAPGLEVSAEIAREDRRVIFITGRPVEFRDETCRWLAAKGFARNLELLMRPNGNYEHAPQLKQRQLGWLLDPNAYYDVRLEDIVTAFDDHVGVVEMYRNHGIDAKVSFIHRINAYKGEQIVHQP